MRASEGQGGAPPSAPSSGPRSRPADPPGPSWAELWRDRHRLETNPLPVWMEWREKFGDVVLVDLGWRRFYFVFHPRHVEWVMKRNAANYVRETPAQDVLRLIQGRGLATIWGAPWRKRRKLLAPRFHARQVSSYAPLMTEMVEDFLAPWEARAEAGEAFDMVAQMVSLAIRVGSSVLIATDLKDYLAELEALIQDLQAEATARVQMPVHLPLWLPLARHRRFNKALARMDEMIYEVIAARRASGEDHDDVLGLLMKVRDPDSGEPFSDELLRDEVLTIAGAAHDTTGLGLTWTWVHLARHPEVRERLYEEVGRVLGGRMPVAEDLERMPWCHQVLEEMMRVTPPIYTLMRRVEAEDEIGGYRIRPGSFMLTSLYVTHRHPDFWDDPERFDPTRFDPGRREQLDPFAYFPFGAGPHICIGKNFALLDTQLILSAIASRYRLDLVPGTEVGVRAGLSYRPDGAVPMTLTRV